MRTPRAAVAPPPPPRPPAGAVAQAEGRRRVRPQLMCPLHTNRRRSLRRLVSRRSVRGPVHTVGSGAISLMRSRAPRHFWVRPRTSKSVTSDSPKQAPDAAPNVSPVRTLPRSPAELFTAHTSIAVRPGYLAARLLLAPLPPDKRLRQLNKVVAAAARCSVRNRGGGGWMTSRRTSPLHARQ